MIVAHVPFLVNLASTDSNVRQRSLERLVTEMISAEELGIDRMVLHHGNSLRGDPRQGLILIAQGINEVFSQLPRSRTMILLETMAGQGSQLGSTFQELAFILERVIMNNRLGICCDTCHMYAAGYDIRSYNGLAKVMQEFDKILGFNRIQAFHLNDSRYPLFSKIDRHCSIGSGLLGFQVFQAIVSDQRFNRIPMIVDNPDRDRKSLHDPLLLKRLRADSATVVDPLLPEWASSWQLRLIDMNLAEM